MQNQPKKKSLNSSILHHCEVLKVNVEKSSRNGEIKGIT